ncbi:DUF6328 family protein [Streptomyces luteogriseus]|uniref:DUF6328 family protein n=1 Tax=Streptomyces luteogriseus TaxID=68233 RepID=UPI00371663D7
MTRAHVHTPVLPGRAPPLHHARRDAPRRADRDFVELLQELRVTRTGVQILFAFLPSPAFTSRFEISTRSNASSASAPCLLPRSWPPPSSPLRRRRTAVRAARGGSAP